MTKFGIEPTQLDGMPVEVATSMLTAPKAKLSNAMRKTCQRARQRVFASTDTFIRRAGAEELIHAARTGTRTWDEKLVAKLREKSWKQLNLWLARCIKRRFMLQRAYIKLQDKDDLQSQLLRQALEIKVERLDMWRDVCEDEIKRRRTTAASRVAVRKPGRSNMTFRALAAL